MLRRTIVTPLQHVVVRIERIAKGDLTQEEEPTSRSEIGQLSLHLQLMQHSISKTVASVRDGVDVIYQGVSEISADNTDLSSRTEQQAAALEETAASMEQLTATVKQNTDAHRVSQLANEASERASNGGKIVSGVVATMGNISSK